ncbi:ribosome recycling factor [Bacillus mesophilus]|uniref:Uncharacterized protein n=1 Tax=Bacillus mesophilus TaxID=1808955 RepID=A0A6M0Q2D1_9BACI|nr:hypothetical protein [Bacillus mesophilus]MBM7659685.1 ribosome recycling factor [Bacillus mesophilus]NEY70551.1 hypothetical protein [Bacillus mesophilus]
MQKNARGFVQESYSALTNARENLQQALNTVEKNENRGQIEDSLRAVEDALQQCNQTVERLEQA